VLSVSRAVGLAIAFAMLVMACTPAAPAGVPAGSTPAAAKPEGAAKPERTPTVAPTARAVATPEDREHNLPTPVAVVPSDIKVTTVLEGVMVPMSMRFAPDGRLFFNEVTKGTVRIMGADGVLQPEPFVTLKVADRKEMGALGLALDPNFATNHWVYVFYSQAKNDKGDPQDNRIVRFTERDGKATEQTSIFKDLPAGICCHNGGRIGFGPDGKLYVTVGDVNEDDKAQNPNRLNGKILRLNPDGGTPTDNPVPGSPVFASGFRNPFGLAFHPQTGLPYISENGEVGHDEVNRVVAGGNYGNPIAEGWAHDPRFLDPVWESGTGRVAPTGAAFYTGTAMPEYTGDFFFCSYNTGDLTRIRLGGPKLDQIAQQEVLNRDCRLDVADAPDGSLYLAGFVSILRLGR
jgi:glucose/arabinose dehydrogenase